MSGNEVKIDESLAENKGQSGGIRDGKAAISTDIVKMERSVCAGCFIGRFCSKFARAFGFRRETIPTHCKDSKVDAGKLDTVNHTPVASLLSGDLRSDKSVQNSDRVSGGNIPGDTIERRYHCGEGITMQTFKLQPNEIRGSNFSVVVRKGKVEYVVQSDTVIKVFLVDRENLLRFRGGNDFDSINKMHKGKNLQEEITLYKGVYYFIFYNPSKDIAAVSFDVYA